MLDSKSVVCASNSDLRNNPITKFEIQLSDLPIFRNLTEFRVTPFASEACAKSNGVLRPVGKHGAIQICVLAGKQAFPASTRFIELLVVILLTDVFAFG